MSEGATVVVAMQPLLLRRRDAAAALAISETQLLTLERAGLLRPVRLAALPGNGRDGRCRAVRYRREDVEALAARLCNQAELPPPPTGAPSD